MSWLLFHQIVHKNFHFSFSFAPHGESGILGRLVVKLVEGAGRPGCEIVWVGYRDRTVVSETIYRQESVLHGYGMCRPCFLSNIVMFSHLK